MVHIIGGRKNHLSIFGTELSVILAHNTVLPQSSPISPPARGNQTAKLTPSSAPLGCCWDTSVGKWPGKNAIQPSRSFNYGACSVMLGPLGSALIW